jgi:membrane protein implicated in regulation of membrane protease activity
VFLFSFGLVGLILQQVIAGIFGRPGPWWLAAPLAVAVALPFTRLFGRLVSRILPGDETTAVARESLVGRWATIVTGKAEVGSAAQARVRDVHGQTHYVMIEPDDAGEIFDEGSQVIIVRHAGARFFAIQNTSASLRDL